VDKGQFTTMEVREGRESILSAVIHPDGQGAAVRLCIAADANAVLAAHRLACVLSALHLQRSQRELVARLVNDLETTLGDYMEADDEEEKPPF